MFHTRSKPIEDQKHDAVIQDAQNPDTKTTSEDAEQALINDTKRAGGAAFQFDPDASPEEKAASARSVSGRRQSETLILTPFKASAARLPP